MKIKAVDGKLSVGSLFGPIALGYGIGAGVIFMPAVLLIALISFLWSPGMVDQGGQIVAAGPSVAMMLIMVPAILAGQGVMIGGLVIMGLAIYRKWGTLHVISVREVPESEPS